MNIVSNQTVISNFASMGRLELLHQVCGDQIVVSFRTCYTCDDHT